MSGQPLCRCAHTATSPKGEIYVSDGYGMRRSIGSPLTENTCLPGANAAASRGNSIFRTTSIALRMAGSMSPTARPAGPSGMAGLLTRCRSSMFEQERLATPDPTNQHLHGCVIQVLPVRWPGATSRGPAVQSRPAGRRARYGPTRPMIPPLRSLVGPVSYKLYSQPRATARGEFVRLVSQTALLHMHFPIRHLCRIVMRSEPQGSPDVGRHLTGVFRKVGDLSGAPSAKDAYLSSHFPNLAVSVRLGRVSVYRDRNSSVIPRVSRPCVALVITNFAEDPCLIACNIKATRLSDSWMNPRMTS